MALISYDLFKGKIDKVQLAMSRLEHYEPEEGYVLGYSGGKDSDVILKLAKMSGVKYIPFHNLTTIDPPEVIYHIKKQGIKINNPKKHLLARMVEKGCPPSRKILWCCDEYKEYGEHDKCVVLGIRSHESISRKFRPLFQNCSIKKRCGRQLNPIIDWTDSDVWEFMKKCNINYCKLYDRGFKRIGCIMCPRASEKVRKFESEYYPNYTKLFKRYYVKLYKKLIRKGKPVKRFWDNGIDFFCWWLKGNTKATELELFNL